MQLHQAAHGVETKDHELSAKDKQSHQATRAVEAKDQIDIELSSCAMFSQRLKIAVMMWPKTKTFSTMMGKSDGSDTHSTSVVTSETKCPEASVHLHQWMDVTSETKCPEASIDPK